MAETRTSRFELVQWGVGTDSPSRIDFNEAFLNLENRAAYDDGVTYTALPVTHLVAGRYVLLAPESSPGVPTGVRTLYRRSDAASWDWAGGNTINEKFTVRPLNGIGAGGPARTTAALELSHPDAPSNPGASFAYDGSSILGGTMRLHDYVDAAKGTLIVGAAVNLAADPVANGRVHVRTKASGERGIVVRPYGSASGALFTAQEASGNDLFVIDSVGRVRHQTFSAWGGAAMPTTSVMAVSPTSNPADDIVNGLALYGQSGADTKRILNVARDAADAADPILSIDRENIGLGRLPWGSLTANGKLTSSGRQLLQRATGYTADALLWRLNRADLSTPTDAGLDETVASYSRTSSLTRVPAVISQALSTGGVNLSLKRYTNFSGPFLELHRVTGSEVVETIGRWDAAGSILSGARWINPGTLRDARQALVHRTKKGFTGSYTTGQTQSQVWTAMQTRSATVCDLDIEVIVETEISSGLFSDKEDGQQWFVICDININGGGWTQLDSNFGGGPAHRDGSRPINVQPASFYKADIPVGATFQLRTRVVIGGAQPAVTVRAIWIKATEVIFNEYVTA